MTRPLPSLLLLLVLAAPASAVPAPMSPAELAKNSDVVATVRVLGVACTGHTTAASRPVLTFQAWAQVVTVVKGQVKRNETVLISWRDLPKGLIGGWKVEYYPGEEVATHLKWNPEMRTYTTTWWNAKGQPTKPPVTKELPDRPGTILSGL